MTQDTSTYYVWIGGSCDYGHKERAGGAAVVIEHNGNIISRDVISDLHTTEFRMMLTLMVKVMQEIPEGSDILFLTNAAYIQNFGKTPTAKSANPDLIIQCIEEKKRHNSVGVKIVQYHKSPLLIETHDRATEAMLRQGRSFIRKINKCLEAFPVIKVTVIKVIKDFRLFKISPKLSLNAPLSYKIRLNKVRPANKIHS